MDPNTFPPASIIQIEGQALSTDITGEITSCVFDDNADELHVMDLSVSNRCLRFLDDPLFQEGGNEIVAPKGLTPVVTPTVGRHLRVVQSNRPSLGIT